MQNYSIFDITLILMKCIFCNSLGPFNTVEHIIPQSLGNDDEVLLNCVCDKCQNYFGKEIERYVLEKTPLGFWRTHQGIKTKKGKLPSVNLSSTKDKGRFPSESEHHDEGISFSYHEDCSVKIDISDDDVITKILSGEKEKFQFVFSPKVLFYLGRFLGKMGIEFFS